MRLHNIMYIITYYYYVCAENASIYACEIYIFNKKKKNCESSFNFESNERSGSSDNVNSLVRRAPALVCALCFDDNNKSQPLKWHSTETK